MKRFCIGDIHGSYKTLVQVLKKSNFDYENDLLISLGDIVDGGPDSYECVEELLKIKNRIDILGNHDEWFINFIDTGIHGSYWGQGAHTTRDSYMKNTNHSYKFSFNDHLIPVSHKGFFRDMNRYYELDNMYFIHGGFDRHKPIGETPRDQMIWDRSFLNQAMSAKNSNNFNIVGNPKKVFLGHTTTQFWDTTNPIICGGGKVINLDTGAGNINGKLTIMNIDTMEYFQSDLNGELYDEFNGKNSK